jgi:hypothetical protein
LLLAILYMLMFRVYMQCTVQKAESRKPKRGEMLDMVRSI